MIMCIGDENDGNVDRYAISQIKMICDTEAAKGSNIVVMPDVHPGKVGPIGLTMTSARASLLVLRESASMYQVCVTRECQPILVHSTSVTEYFM